MATNETTTGNQKKDGLKWKEVTIGGISGIILGSAGSFAASAATLNNNEDISDSEVTDENAENSENNDGVATENQEVAVAAHGNVASGVNDNMSFNEAFAAARSEVGAGGCFVWHGNVYGTYYASEWNAMSSAQRDEFVSQTTGVDTSHSHDPQQTYAHHSTGTQTQQGAGTPEKEETGEEDMTVEVLGVEQVQNEDGSVSNIGVAGINGQAVYFIDVDGQDDQFELMATDINANGRLEENEITDISDQHMSVSQFQDLAQNSSTGTGSSTGNEVEEYYASNENLPDYVNDADPVDLA